MIVTPLEDSKQISQVLANDTARKILDFISDESLSSSQISKRLSIPLTTVEYNVKRLQDVGLIKVDKKKWSEKGRIVKYYVPQEKFIVIAPKMRRAQVIQTLRRMLPFVGLIALISAVIEFVITPFIQPTALGAQRVIETREPMGGVLTTIPEALRNETVVTVTQVPPHYGLWFFIMAMLILVILISFNHYYKKVKR